MYFVSKRYRKTDKHFHVLCFESFGRSNGSKNTRRGMETSHDELTVTKTFESVVSRQRKEGWLDGIQTPTQQNMLKVNIFYEKRLISSSPTQNESQPCGKCCIQFASKNIILSPSFSRSF